MESIPLANPLTMVNQFRVKAEETSSVPCLPYVVILRVPMIAIAQSSAGKNSPRKYNMGGG
jgi:hypothetical protein